MMIRPSSPGAFSFASRLVLPPAPHGVQGCFPPRHATAEKFAAELSAEGCTCTICQQLRTIKAQRPEDENAGIFAPSTMHRPVTVARVAA